MNEQYPHEGGEFLPDEPEAVSAQLASGDVSKGMLFFLGGCVASMGLTVSGGTYALIDGISNAADVAKVVIPGFVSTGFGLWGLSHLYRINTVQYVEEDMDRSLREKPTRRWIDVLGRIGLGGDFTKNEPDE